MDDLIAWLRAQLDIDQAHAEKDLALLNDATGRGEWTWHPGSNLPFSEVHADGGVLARIHTPRHQADTMVIARLVKAGRARATERLAEIDAKRRILDRYERALANRKRHRDDIASAGALLALLGAVKDLALPYAGRPDYREEWRPDTPSNRKGAEA